MNHSLCSCWLRLCCYLTFLCLGSYHTVHAQEAASDTSTPQTLAELKAAVETIRKDTQTPAIGIALVNQTGPQWVAGLGLASLEQQTPADENTLFRIGSITKMFVGIAVLKLVEEGRVSLDDKLSDLAPDLEFQNPWEDTHPIRLVHLLEHTTGWDDMSLREYALEAPDSMSVKEGLDYRPDSRKSRWVPGTRVAYCNTGPAVAAYIVERITGKRFEDYVQALIFDPLNMHSTSFFRSPGYQERGATLYVNGAPQDYWQIITRPAGSVNSSANDMANFLHLLIQRGEVAGQQIISPTSFARMEIAKTNLGSAAGITAAYGLHNYTGGHENYHVAFRGHNGGMEGALAELSYVPELEAGYVIMINSGNFQALSSLAKLLRGYLLKDLTPPEVEPAPLPEAFKHLSGFYLPTNYRSDFTRMFSDIQAVVKISTSDNYLHRAPLLGGWKSNDYAQAADDKVLIDGWTGLPTVALVEDPLIGSALQVGPDLFRPISAARAYGVLAANLLTLLVSLLSLICFLVWGLRRLLKRLPIDNGVRVRVWPLAASACLFAVILAPSINNSIVALGRVSVTSVTMAMGSILYAVATLVAVWMLWHVYSQKRRHGISCSRWIYGYACLHTGLHVFMVGQLALYGLIGIRTWV